MRGPVQQIRNFLQREVPRRLPSLHIEPLAIEASSNHSSTHVSFTPPFLRLRHNSCCKKTNFHQSHSITMPLKKKTGALSGFAPMSLTLFQPSHFPTTSRPVSVCRIRPASARMSTDRPAAESVLSHRFSETREEPLQV